MLYLIPLVGCGWQRPFIFDFLLADLAPARHLGGIIHGCGPGMNQVARPNDIQEVLRIVGVERVFHGVQVIQIAKEFIEAVDGGQEFILVTKMVLAELSGRIALRFQHGGDRDGFRGMPIGAPAWPTVVIPVRMGSSPMMKFARPAVQLASA